MAGGDVSRDDVVRVLRANGVTVSRGGEYFTMSRPTGECETQWLGARVPRSMVHRLARRFGIDVHHFYHPSKRQRQRP